MDFFLREIAASGQYDVGVETAIQQQQQQKDSFFFLSSFQASEQNLSVNGGLSSNGNETTTFDDLEGSQEVEEAASEAFEVAMIILLIVLDVITVLGNLLIIVAVHISPKLRTVTNCFILSLGVADFLVGLCVLPPAIMLRMTKGVWLLGWLLCDAWISLDVLLCTASILSLCAISIDRYLAISRPITYSKMRRSKSLATKIIAGVWMLSVLITCPPMLGWSEPDRHGPKEEDCRYNENVGYVVYSACGSFYLPMLVILYTYARIICLVRRRNTEFNESYQRDMGINRQQSTFVDHSEAVTATTTTTTASSSIRVSVAAKGGGSSKNKYKKKSRTASHSQKDEGGRKNYLRNRVMGVSNRALKEDSSPRFIRPPDNGSILKSDHLNSKKPPSYGNCVGKRTEAKPKPQLDAKDVIAPDLLASERINWHFIDLSITDGGSNALLAAANVDEGLRCKPTKFKGEGEEDTHHHHEQQQCSSCGGSKVLRGGGHSSIVHLTYVEEEEEEEENLEGVPKKKKKKTRVTLSMMRTTSVDRRNEKTCFSCCIPSSSASSSWTPTTATVEDEEDEDDNKAENALHQRSSSSTNGHGPKAAGSRKKKKQQRPSSLTRREDEKTKRNCELLQRLDSVSAVTPTTTAADQPVAAAATAPLSASADPHRCYSVHRNLHLREARTAKRLAIVVGLFITCWLPFFVGYVVAPFLSREQFPDNIYGFLTWLGWINSAVNPFIYASYSPTFRAVFFDLTLGKIMLVCSKIRG